MKDLGDNRDSVIRVRRMKNKAITHLERRDRPPREPAKIDSRPVLKKADIDREPVQGSHIGRIISYKSLVDECPGFLLYDLLYNKATHEA